MPRIKGGVYSAPTKKRMDGDGGLIRWSINRASIEFGCDAGFLSRRLKKEGIIPGVDGYYSTPEMMTALVGDVDRERSRKLSADADRSEMVNKQLSRELVTKTAALRFITNVAATIAARLKTFPMAEEDLDACLNDLQVCFREHEVTKALYDGQKVIGSDETDAEDAALEAEGEE